MAGWLSVLAALAENLGVVSSTHRVVHNDL